MGKKNKPEWDCFRVITDEEYDRNMSIIGLRVKKRGAVYTKKYIEYLKDKEKINIKLPISGEIIA